MKIYLYDVETGIFQGEDWSDEPFFSDGPATCPAGATAVAPPPHRGGAVPVFNVKENCWVPPSGSPGAIYASGYDLHPGKLLDDRFMIEECVGQSGMASVFRAIDRASGAQVAVKVPHLQYESDPGFFSRFAREGEIGERLDHPSILKFIPVEKRSRPYLVTEFLRGRPLSHLLKESGPLHEGEALSLASRICDGIAHMHQRRVIHRDLKPQNVMICDDGSIRILDFGIAKSIGRRHTFAGFTPALGTPEYMAPEQVLGKRGDERTDIYTLGVILYQMVTGKIPFLEGAEDVFAAMNARVTGDPAAPSGCDGNISSQVEEIILHAMERLPEGRYPSAAAMKEELDHPERVEVTGRCQRLQAPRLWKRYLKSGILLALLLSAVLFIFVKVILLIIKRGP
ncbi:serine/threonine protein kinase [Geomonas sp. Red32]|uniref:serine/threonine protein kinase n=1 Tax=Geomonas sp. Red32 TaxID=2912856 RepID=UPI00202D00DB|nr:serine/threonine-protein kinase [Geomonas sp. Red32]MCM0084469.1 serine/threonine protein kinase [Geomonas sp. Red32]